MKVEFNYGQAKRVLSLINEYREFDSLNTGDVLDLNSVATQLQVIINKYEDETA